ncbi:hypothetical protein WJ0W_000779 [Paenibacillus melissococcoides]|uniref:Uncharacterized protein n=1 Tax=Paenibacillus melissococcoides TaxID=2912268 RepID=A0ABN8TY60_9BACL|nr:MULTISPECIES: hypothetical protein [Paenibacillus]MEB9893321.1 hypothetical protein [Bacillus cereus]CAH8243539.1 hypothetical protein WJ0W_000779 [Paenibacillus melissococcoides]CAH8704809.1 hypothetical protein WDD9_000765 [Paenibacillus melissococcoides]CAH8708034.1 hypothetical protein HTL2_001851 [Paenibacillus melissococcoides]GIO76408.1 hypothetical protein J6TS7_00180 [Paenibacillus dendritiformis]
MFTNQTEAEEREHLRRTLTRIRTALQAIDHKISAARQDIIEAKKYVWSNLSQLDPAERAANRVDISLTIDHGEKAVEKQRRLRKLLDDPYFGRVDFVADDLAESGTYYIGGSILSVTKTASRMSFMIGVPRSPGCFMIFRSAGPVIPLPQETSRGNSGQEAV